MGYGYSGAFNTYALSLEASGGLTAAFSRNPKSFRLNLYHELRPVTKKAGYYLRFSPDQAARVLFSDGRDSLWLDRADRPNINNGFSFEFETYKTQRHNFGDTLGRLAVEQAEFMLQELEQSGLGQKCMTNRTLWALNALSAQSWGSNTSDVDGGLLTGGQNWGNGTLTTNNFWISLMAGVSQIVKATGGVVQPEDLVLLVGPDTAIALRSSPEFNQTFIQSPLALDFVRGEANVNAEWGIPGVLNKIRIVIENAVENTAAAGATASMNFCLAKGTAYLLCRPKDRLVVAGPDGMPYQDEDAPPVKSTLIGFAKEDFTVEIFDEPKHRRVELDVVTDVSYNVSSPLSGYKFTRCFG